MKCWILSEFIGEIKISIFHCVELFFFSIKYQLSHRKVPVQMTSLFCDVIYLHVMSFENINTYVQEANIRKMIHWRSWISSL